MRAGSERARAWPAVVTATAVRWLFCWLLFPLFFASHSTVGAQYELDSYSRLAAQILAGNGYRVSPDATANLNRPPAYALLLTLTFPWKEQTYLFFQALNGLLGGLAVWLTWKAAGAAALSRTSQAFAAWSLALWPFSIWETKVSVPENLLVAILPAVIYALARWRTEGRAGWALACGVLSGIAALTHAVDQLLIAAVPLMMLLAPLAWRKRFLSAAAALLAALVLVGPWIARNERIAGYRVGVSTGFGLHYFKGIYDFGLLRSGAEYFRDNDDAAMRDAIALVERHGFKVADDEALRNDPAINRFLDTAARRDLAARPLLNLEKTIVKMPLLWIQQQNPARALATTLLLAPWMILAAAGAAARRPGWLFLSIAALLVALNAGTAAVFIEAMPMRYALPLLPLLFLLSARGLEVVSSRRFVSTGTEPG